jgi:hypothetical protein
MTSCATEKLRTRGSIGELRGGIKFAACDDGKRAQPRRCSSGCERQKPVDVHVLPVAVALSNDDSVAGFDVVEPLLLGRGDGVRHPHSLDSEYPTPRVPVLQQMLLLRLNRLFRNNCNPAWMFLSKVPQWSGSPK